MKTLKLLEHRRLYLARDGEDTGTVVGDRTYLSAEHFDALRRFDERHAPVPNDQVFEWRSNWVKARQWVGVVQIPGLTIEILPKISPVDNSDHKAQELSSKNLLYMLSVARMLPLKERDLADLKPRQAPLLDALVRLYATHLRDELSRGREHHYISEQRNLHVLRGKLQFSQHVRHNAAHAERFFVEHDTFAADTLLNRIFKAACRRLLELCTSPAALEPLSHCLLMLDNVADTPIQPHDFDRVHITRQNERFAMLLDFSRLVLSNLSPTGSHGGARNFSLLFDMNVVYERFLTEFIRRYVLNECEGLRLYPQSRGRRKHIVRDKAGDGHLELKPDILIEYGDRTLVLDTKWKVLEPSKNERQGVAREDLYQMFGYVKRYPKARAVLLYPKTSHDLRDVDFHTDERSTGQPEGHHPATIAVRLVDLDRDLKQSRTELVSDLRAMLCELLPESRMQHRKTE